MGSDTIESFFLLLYDWYCEMKKSRCFAAVCSSQLFHNPFFYFEIQLSSCVG